MTGILRYCIKFQGFRGSQGHPVILGALIYLSLGDWGSRVQIPALRPSFRFTKLPGSARATACRGCHGTGVLVGRFYLDGRAVARPGKAVAGCCSLVRCPGRTEDLGKAHGAKPNKRKSAGAPIGSFGGPTHRDERHLASLAATPSGPQPVDAPGSRKRSATMSWIRKRSGASPPRTRRTAGMPAAPARSPRSAGGPS